MTEPVNIEIQLENFKEIYQCLLYAKDNTEKVLNSIVDSLVEKEEPDKETQCVIKMYKSEIKLIDDKIRYCKMILGHNSRLSL